jgi:pimeloyl-ACP methyl ester carboxylesterase
MRIGLGVVAAAVAGVGIAAYTPDESRARLEARYRVPASDYVELVRLRLHFRDTGPRAAPAIVLLHGFGSSLQTWDAWAERLSETYRVVRYDLPGFGLTGPDPTGDYSEARGIEVLQALLDHLQLQRTILIGNSMGGKLAWEFAARHPERVEKLVLVSPDGFASPGFAYGQPPSVPAPLRLLPYAMPKGLLRMSLAPAYGDPAALSDDIVTRYWDMMRAPGVRRAIIERLGQTILEDPEPILQQVTTPTLLVWGEKDGMIPFDNSADYLRNLPHATLVPLPGLGHVPQEEAPAESLAPVLAFLSTMPAPGEP